jgi:elongator complex protein 1
VNSILTAHVSKSPPDLEAGLALLLRLRGEEEFPMESLFIKPLTIIHLESDQEIVEDAIKYIIYLVDADRLFDCALGMYDFNLVLMIAQHSQKVASYMRSLFLSSEICSQFHFRIPENTFRSLEDFENLKDLISDLRSTII